MNRNRVRDIRALGAVVWIALLVGARNAQAQEQDAGVEAQAPPQTQPPEQAYDAGAVVAATPDQAAQRQQEEAEIAAELAALQPADDVPGSPPGESAASGASVSSRGLSNLLNPAISATGTLFAGYTTRHDAAENAPDDLRAGITLQEIEIRASAIVDPYFRADVSIAGNLDEIGFEEAVLTTLELPRVTLRAGQMIANVGRHNLLHTHAFPFITGPLPWRTLFGAEGLRDPGVSADILLPTPFFAEVNTQVFAGEWPMLQGSVPDDPLTPLVDESRPDQRRDRDLAYVGHLKLLFDLSDSTTMELGGSYLGGRNGFGGWTSAAQADLTLKWRPVEAERYTGVEWTTEYVWVDREHSSVDRIRGGGYTAVRAQFAQRWWVQARGALLGLPRGDSAKSWRAEALVAFVPSEFSTLRLQYAIEDPEDGNNTSNGDLVHELFAQIIFSLGPHPAHAY